MVGLPRELVGVSETECLLCLACRLELQASTRKRVRETEQEGSSGRGRQTEGGAAAGVLPQVPCTDVMGPFRS